MNAAAHTAISGLSAFAGVAWLKSRNPTLRLPSPAFAAIVAGLASGLPDVLEPATSPHHRQFCHSVVFVGLVVATMKRVYDWQPKTPGEELLRDTLLSIGIGYLTHLAADATTARSLPWIGKFGDLLT